MCLDETTDDGQAEPSARRRTAWTVVTGLRCAGALAAKGHVEDSGQVSLWNAAAGVGDGQPDLTPLGAGIHWSMAVGLLDCTLKDVPPYTERSPDLRQAVVEQNLQNAALASTAAGPQADRERMRILAEIGLNQAALGDHGRAIAALGPALDLSSRLQRDVTPDHAEARAALSRARLALR